jgi:UDP-GlcNAc:undecaprenyl-phosphate GlcNAc-1-phosphate transferase
MTEVVYSFITALCLSFASIKFFSYIFYKLWMVDNPEKYMKKRDPVPYGMWIIFFITFFATSFLFIEYNYKLGLIWVFGFLVTIVSFIDDKINLSAKYRLSIQIFIGAIIALTSIKIGYVSNIFWWVIELETLFFQIGSYTLYIIPFVFTILWYVFIFNALNWTDWLSGNASGLSAISFFILFLLGYILFLSDTYQGWIDNALFIMKMCIILVWILIPFWYFDVREKILMGDTGTMFLWFMLATIAIISGGKIATVLVVFWIYSVDAVYVIVKRFMRWKNPLQWDFTHLHHRLEKIGLSKTQFLSLVYSLSFCFWITALFLDKLGKILVFFLIVLIVIFINTILGKTKKFIKK